MRRIGLATDEYLMFDIVPILDFPLLGDLANMGMRWLPFSQFCEQGLPDEKTRREIVLNNREALRRFQAAQQEGMWKLAGLLQ